ncbi:uncharacterized protein LOC120670153 isoform X2 [Panicum virgatum]|uniref:uncharacterized protein LOC120670153 isoform X2 n=1 Tax=Panicum virgatum TaxID=38727 RepID=UPI0019D5CE9D|nr:uncharacterized protein LOC120670153 isoform X2 [Panicum virgatum]
MGACESKRLMPLDRQLHKDGSIERIGALCAQGDLKPPRGQGELRRRRSRWLEREGQGELRRRRSRWLLAAPPRCRTAGAERNEWICCSYSMSQPWMLAVPAASSTATRFTTMDAEFRSCNMAMSTVPEDMEATHENFEADLEEIDPA